MLHSPVGRITSSKTSLWGYYLRDSEPPSKTSQELASAPTSAPPQPFVVSFAGAEIQNTGKKSLMEMLETLKVEPGYATRQFVVSGEGFYYFFGGILWVHARPFSSPVGLQLGRMQ